MYEVENEMLDQIYEALPESQDFVKIYPPRDDLPRAEMYWERDGTCYTVVVIKHPHVQEM